MKRENTGDPLTADDVAERLSNAMLRTWRILLDVRQDPELYKEVRGSRYFTVFPHQLIEELELWRHRPASNGPRTRWHMDCYTSQEVVEMSGKTETLTMGCLLNQDDCPMKP